MTCNWDSKPLGELLEFVIDHRGKTPNKMGFENFHSFGHPVLSAKHVKTDALVNLDSIRFASEEMYKKWMKVEIKEGDIALTSEAPLGEVFYLDGQIKYVLGQRIFGLRVKRELIEPLYLVAWLASKKGREQLHARASGSTVLGIKQSELLKIDVDVPPRDVQISIAKIRYNLSKKIELNRQTNQALEQIAETIFKSWFVDFEPTRAKIAAKEAGATAEEIECAAMRAISGKSAAELSQLSSEAQQQLKITAALFPDALMRSELGAIPDGWATQKIEDVIELAYGRALKKTDRIAGEFPVYGSGGVTGTSNESLVVGPGIIVGRKGTVGSLYWEDRSFYPIDTVFYVKCKNNMTLAFSYYLLQTLRLEDMNTDAAVPGLNRSNVYRLEIPKIPISLIDIYSKVAMSVLNSIRIGLEEARTLEAIKDELLPKLLSGEFEIAGES